MHFFILKNSYLLLLPALLLSGCAKDSGSTLVEGQVVVQQTQQPVGNATIFVERAGSGGGYALVGQGYPTDADGRFSFHFEATSKAGYILVASAPPGYLTDQVRAPSLRPGRKNQGVIVPVLAPAWVRLQLVDEPPRSRVSMYVSGYEGDGDRLYFPRDTTFTRILQANFPYKIIWVITNDQGLDSQYSQDVQVAALDTATVRIPF